MRQLLIRIKRSGRHHLYVIRSKLKPSTRLGFTVYPSLNDEHDEQISDCLPQIRDILKKLVPLEWGKIEKVKAKEGIRVNEGESNCLPGGQEMSEKAYRLEGYPNFAEDWGSCPKRIEVEKNWISCQVEVPCYPW